MYDALSQMSSYITVILGLLLMQLKFMKRIEHLDRTAQQNHNQVVLKEGLQMIHEPLMTVMMNRMILDCTDL